MITPRAPANCHAGEVNTFSFTTTRCKTSACRTKPGQPKHPGAERIDIDEDDNVIGLF